jgi:putative protease
MGRVKDANRDHIVIEPNGTHSITPLKAGDGVVFDAADWRSPQEAEEGGRLYRVAPLLSGDLELQFANGAVQASRIRPGDVVWRTHDPTIERKAHPFLQAPSPVHKQIVQVLVTARVGERLAMEWTLERRPDLQATVSSAEPLVAAKNHGVATDRVRAQVERLGNTAYELGRLDVETDGIAFLPVSLLNQLRREAVDALQKMEEQARPARVDDPNASVDRLLQQVTRQTISRVREPALHVLVRTPEQLDAALSLAPESITLDYLDLYGLRSSVESVKKCGIEARVASPRVMKPGEARIADFLASLDCSIVVRSAGLLEALAEKTGGKLIGDFSLNVANSLSAHAILRFGLHRITPTHDLNAAQVADLASVIGPERVEAIAYQHLPVFHTEHCVFCRFLSTGTSYRNCGRPCETHRISLRDEHGREHPVLADVGCRNTVFGAEAQEASAHLDRWLDAGLRDLRLEFVQESGEQLTRVVKVFKRLAQGQISAAELGAALREMAPAGTTEGSLFIAKNYTALPVLQ